VLWAMKNQPPPKKNPILEVDKNGVRKKSGV
jgi:hypothetical protein